MHEITGNIQRITREYWHTLSSNVNHISASLLRSRFARGSLTSPRNWFRPNLSQSHTLSHTVRDDNSDSDNGYYMYVQEIIKMHDKHCNEI